MNTIHLVTFCSAQGRWTCTVCVGALEITRADGRDEGAAVADAVAKFRCSRGCR